MKKYFVSFFLIIAFAFYLLLNNQSSTDVAPTDGNPVAVVTPIGNASGTPATSTPITTPTPTSTPTTTAGIYKDGTYNGNVADAIYGKLQVAAVIKNGALNDVQILQKPDAPGHTTEVSGTSLPQLVQEAIQIQGAKVDIVSGATQTSEAFQQSLGNALAQAKT